MFKFGLNVDLITESNITMYSMDYSHEVEIDTIIFKEQFLMLRALENVVFNVGNFECRTFQDSPASVKV